MLNPTHKTWRSVVMVAGVVTLVVVPVQWALPVLLAGVVLVLVLP